MCGCGALGREACARNVCGRSGVQRLAEPGQGAPHGTTGGTRGDCRGECPAAQRCGARARNDSQDAIRQAAARPYVGTRRLNFGYPTESKLRTRVRRGGMLADFDAQPHRVTPPVPELSPTQREADEAELYAGLHGVAGIVAGGRGVMDLLRDVAEFAAQAIPGADGVGVALIDPQHGISSVQTWAATALLVHDIDTVQYSE